MAVELVCYKLNFMCLLKQQQKFFFIIYFLADALWYSFVRLNQANKNAFVYNFFILKQLFSNLWVELFYSILLVFFIESLQKKYKSQNKMEKKYEIFDAWCVVVNI